MLQEIEDKGNVEWDELMSEINEAGQLFPEQLQILSTATAITSINDNLSPGTPTLSSNILSSAVTASLADNVIAAAVNLHEISDNSINNNQNTGRETSNNDKILSYHWADNDEKWASNDTKLLRELKLHLEEQHSLEVLSTNLK